MTPEFIEAIKPIFGGKVTAPQLAGVTQILAASEGLHRQVRAYLLATAKWETAHTMQPIHERGRVSYFDKYEPGTKVGKRLGNTVPGDGYLFRGRGFVQITGRANYAKAGRTLGLDMIKNPDAALNPDVAARILVRGCTEGWFTGKRLSDYLPGDYVNARRVVNGTDRAQEIAGIAERFEAAFLAHLPDAPKMAATAPKPGPRPARPTKPRPAAPRAAPANPNGIAWVIQQIGRAIEQMMRGRYSKRD